MQYASLIKFAKKCWKRFWSFNFHWENKSRHWIYFDINCETVLNLLSQHHHSSIMPWLEFKFRNTFATLAKYKFSLMFPDVSEDLRAGYCACVCLCAVCVHACTYVLFHYFLFLLYVSKGSSWAILHSSTASTWWEVGVIMSVHRVLDTRNTRVHNMGHVWFTYWRYPIHAVIINHI